MKTILVVVITVFWTLAIQLSFTLHPSYAAGPDGLCLTESEFTAFNTMTETDIRNWLRDTGPTGGGGGWLSVSFTDLDGSPTDAAEQINIAAQKNKINPRVLLTTLRKESPQLFNSSAAPDSRDLMKLAGCGTSPTARQQIQCMGESLKRYFYDQLSQCKPTIGGWYVDLNPPKQTGDTGNEITASGAPCSVMPESKTVAALFQYTPWKGRGYDGCGYGDPLYPMGVPGNWAFCWLWRLHGWEVASPPLALTPNPTMLCAPPTPQQPSRCISVNASGGTPGPGYTWSIPGAVVDPPTGVNKQNVKIRPPANPGAKDFPGQIAYIRVGTHLNWFFSCFGSSRGFDRQDFDCDDGAFGACQNNAFGIVGNTQVNCCENHGQIDCIPPGGPICYPPNQGTCGEIFMGFCNRRSPQMISGGCNPCGLSMQGVIITVTDSATPPASASTTIRVQ